MLVSGRPPARIAFPWGFAEEERELWETVPFPAQSNDRWPSERTLQVSPVPSTRRGSAEFALGCPQVGEAFPEHRSEGGSLCRGEGGAGRTAF